MLEYFWRDGGVPLKAEEELFVSKSIFVKIRSCVSIDQSKLDSSRDN